MFILMKKQVNSRTTVAQLKRLIEDSELSLAVARQRLCVDGAWIDDDDVQLDDLQVFQNAPAVLIALKRFRPGPAVKMRITLRGVKSNVFEVDGLTTIAQVKAKMQRAEGIPPDQQSFAWFGRPMADDSTLDDYNVPAGAIVRLVLHLRGC